MSDQDSGVNELVEQTNQPDPAGENQETEAQGTEPQEADQPSETETDATETSEETNDVEEQDNPRSNAAWAKLRTENKALKQAVEQSGVDAEYLNLLREASAPQQVDYSANVDQYDQQAQMSARALNEVQSLKNELEFERDKVARDKHRDLFNDPEFEAMVAKEKLVTRVLGINKSTVQIADEVADFWNRRSGGVSQEAQLQAEQRFAQKQKATIQPATTSSGGNSTSTIDQLADRARRGDIKAQEQLVKERLLSDLNF